jgi:polysaccharide export outer membrane protein
MMHINAKNARIGRAVQRTLRVTLTAGLLLGVGWTLRAGAQVQDATTPKPPDQAQTDKVQGTPMLGDEAIDPNQPIKPNFIINVSVVGEPDPSGNYVVDPAGNVSVRYQGVQTPVSVRGLTPGQAADVIAKFLKTYIKNPQVTVTILQVPRPVVFVAGAVKNPGPIIISNETTLVDVLSHAVWTADADLSNVRIIRRAKGDNGESKTLPPIVVAFDKYIRVAPGTTPDETQNPVLQDKDSVFVPFLIAPGNGVVSVFGEVAKPQQSIPLRTNPPMTVREVVNLVGGTNADANRKAVSIRRATIDRPLVIDLDKAEQGDLVNNIELRPDDAVYVEKLENNAYINVDGGFVKTGKYVYDKRTTLTQAIMEAGGMALYAKTKDGRVFRHPDNDPKNTRVIAFNWDDIEKGKTPDIELQPGDSVWVTPGTPPGQKMDFFSVLSALTTASFLYSNFRNR